MTYFGLHLADWIIIVLYLLGMIWVGKATASSVRGQSDYFLAGRKLGGLFQFFLNFGNMTDASGAAKTSSLVYSQGAGGVWLGMQMLFITPFYWFMNAWFRRVRLTTVADLFIDRFNSRKLATLYAVFNIFFNIVFLGGACLVAYKIGEVLVVKPESAYTQVEARMVSGFREYRALKADYVSGSLAADKADRFEYLQRLNDRGEIKSYVSYLKPAPVYAIFAIVVGVYVILGGMTAAAITDAFQGVVIVIFSIILIPFGLWHLGGWGSFESKLPDRMVDLLGSGGASEFAWYSILTIIVITLVQQYAVVGNMAVAGSARSERAASFGAVSGGFMKRWMTIAWCFCGLIAFAMFGNGLSDPDTAWGALSRTLLGPGFLGLMLVGILAADMSTMSTQCLTLSALFVRNIYMPLFPRKTEREGLMMARILIAVALLLGIIVALFLKDILSFAKLCVTLNVAFGATIIVLFKWRRVTATAALVSVIVTLGVVLVIPYAAGFIPALNSHPALVVKTQEIRETQTRKATGEDIANGRAAQKTDVIKIEQLIAPKPVFFERVLAANPGDTILSGIIALAKTYGKNITWSGPVFDSLKIEGPAARVHFKHTGGGLVARPVPATYQPVSSSGETKPVQRNSPKSELEGFALCDSDGKWHWAAARIEGDSVIVTSPEVPKPVYLRYAWSDFPTVNLFNGAGLPAAPFRTDDFPAVTKNSKYGLTDTEGESQ